MNGTKTASSADWRAIHGAIFVAFLIAASRIPLLRPWPLLWLGPLAAYGALVAAVPPLRATFHPWRFGRLSGRAIAATLILAVGSCSALVAFQLLMHPDLSACRASLPVFKLGGVIATCVVFSVFNALLEEIVFRGILFDAIEAQWGARMALVFTAALFGYFHLHGYPPGPLGGLLAGVFGLALGWLRIFTGGLGLPVLAHITADATIFSILMTSGNL